MNIGEINVWVSAVKYDISGILELYLMLTVSNIFIFWQQRIKKHVLNIFLKKGKWQKSGGKILVEYFLFSH